MKHFKLINIYKNAKKLTTCKKTSMKILLNHRSICNVNLFIYASKQTPALQMKSFCRSKLRMVPTGLGIHGIHI